MAQSINKIYLGVNEKFVKFEASNNSKEEFAYDVVKETEKAVAYEISTTDWEGFSVDKLQWVPKSVLQDHDGKMVVPFWFLSKLA